MKIALSLFSVPFGISFLSGLFYWEFPEGFFVLLGISMLIGIVWAWFIELKRVG
jgi:multidrug efflux pump subunit AcrB